jgi:hypothetical protein
MASYSRDNTLLGALELENNFLYCLGRDAALAVLKGLLCPPLTCFDNLFVPRAPVTWHFVEYSL